MNRKKQENNKMRIIDEVLETLDVMSNPKTMKKIAQAFDILIFLLFSHNESKKVAIDFA
jgi:hypothetical protein